MPNRLANETSPYLLQHKDNPVDWYPWGEEAFTKARAEDKPILLSVGYSSCHWCHVMAHESFEDAGTAELMNRWFVNVKVDREERPDIDGIYMLAVQALTGRGGWPMTVWLDHDLRPFYAGTYFPPEDRHGLPGFPRVLEALHTYWQEERPRLLASAEGITDHLRRAAARPREDRLALDESLPARAVQTFAGNFDPLWGGFGSAPKFPSPANLEFLLTHAARMAYLGSDDGDAGRMALHTLNGMASGGMYDQLGGGFARYSVDARWLVPHFEKMLYDNAQLARVYLHAWQLTGEPLYERIVRETLGYLEREMLHPAGGFYAAQDADSEGIEGKFFVWTPGELREVLGDDAPLAAAVYGVTPEGNFQDPHHPEFGSRTVLTRRYDEEAVLREFSLTREELAARIDSLRQRLFEARSRRVWPGLDDKVLTSWNGLALAAFAEAARVFDDARYRAVAEANAAFTWRELWREGRLLHTWKDGQARVAGMIDDYAFYGLGLVELFRLTGDLEQLGRARALFEVLLREFRDEAGGGFFETAEGGERLLVRQKSFFDDATPSGNGATARLAFDLGRLYEREEWIEVAHECVSLAGRFLLEAPTGFGSLLQVVELLLAPRQELVIAGSAAQRLPFEREAARWFAPWLVLAPGEGGLPLFAGRESSGAARAYVCENMTCGLPAETPEQLGEQLEGALRRGP